MNNQNELAPDSLVVNWNDSVKEFENRLSKESGWRVCKLENGKVTWFHPQKLTQSTLVVMPNTPIADDVISANMQFIKIEEDEEYRLAISDLNTDWSKFKFPQPLKASKRKGGPRNE